MATYGEITITGRHMKSAKRPDSVQLVLAPDQIRVVSYDGLSNYSAEAFLSHDDARRLYAALGKMLAAGPA